MYSCRDIEVMDCTFRVAYLDCLYDVFNSDWLVLFAAAVQACGREDVQESAVAVKQHGNKLGQNDHRKEHQKRHAERLKVLVFCASLRWYANVQCILQCRQKRPYYNTCRLVCST